jgi:hypothetical protein
VRRLAPILAACVLCLLGYLGSTTPHRSQAASTAAPADAYFGPLHMSPLEIRHRIDLLARSFHERSKSDRDILHDAIETEAALHVWRDGYPGDPWLARTAFHLATLFAAIQSPEARTRATAAFRYVARYWPATSYGRTSRVRLQHGFPPLHGESALRPTPNPYARSSPTPSVSPSPVTTVPPTPAQSPAVQSPTPAPSATR